MRASILLVSRLHRIWLTRPTRFRKKKPSGLHSRERDRPIVVRKWQIQGATGSPSPAAPSRT